MYEPERVFHCMITHKKWISIQRDAERRDIRCRGTCPRQFRRNYIDQMSVTDACNLYFSGYFRVDFVSIHAVPENRDIEFIITHYQEIQSHK